MYGCKKNKGGRWGKAGCEKQVFIVGCCEKKVGAVWYDKEGRMGNKCWYNGPNIGMKWRQATRASSSEIEEWIHGTHRRNNKGFFHFPSDVSDPPNGRGEAGLSNDKGNASNSLLNASVSKLARLV
jgi:hypothetical protein